MGYAIVPLCRDLEPASQVAGERLKKDGLTIEIIVFVPGLEAGPFDDAMARTRASGRRLKTGRFQKRNAQHRHKLCGVATSSGWQRPITRTQKQRMKY